MFAKKIAAIFAVLTLVAVPARADWIPGDLYKMHYPQLPDPQGWDVSFTNTPLADDWLCTGSGIVNDIHLWVSFRHDLAPSTVGWVQGRVEIWSDVPPGVDAHYSHPGQRLWGTFIDTRMPNVKMRLWPEPLPVEQGWLDPTIPIVAVPDHTNTYQINIDPVDPTGAAPFHQEEGKIYWLLADLSVVDPAGPTLKEIGWKTSRSPQFRDDAVYLVLGSPVGWVPLEDPRTGQSLDLAFVITPIPEPATVLLLLVGTAGILALAGRRT